MFPIKAIPLFFVCLIKPSLGLSITSEVSAFLEDNGCTYVSVVWNNFERDTEAKDIVMKAAKTLYTRAIDTSTIKYLDEGFHVFPVTLKEEVLKNALHGIGATRVQQSLVVVTETWENSDLGVFLNFVEQGDRDLMFYLVMPSPGNTVSWYKVLSLKSSVVVNVVSFVDGSKHIKNHNFKLQGLELSAITNLGPPFGLSSLDGCIAHETDVKKCRRLEGYFSDMMPLLQRELNFTYELFQEHDWGMGPVAGIRISLLQLTKLTCHRRVISYNHHKEKLKNR